MNPKISNSELVCSAVRSQITDGRAKGARLIHVANGKLNFVLSESNALDIVRLWHRGTNIGFLSKNGLFTAPNDFLHSFPGGMLYTCGFDAIGMIEGHPLHGQLHSMPATLRELVADESGVRIVAEVHQSQLFGENLVLTRTIETAANSGELRLTDEIRNLAFRDERYCQLYHVNFGYPMVDVGAKIGGDILETKPRNEFAAKGIKRALEVEEPLDNCEEACYFHRTGDGVMTLTNRRLGKRVSVCSNLKRFVEWKSRASGDYVIALEPCTSWLDGELRFSTLKPGAKVVNRLKIQIEEI